MSDKTEGHEVKNNHSYSIKEMFSIVMQQLE